MSDRPDIEDFKTEMETLITTRVEMPSIGDERGRRKYTAAERAAVTRHNELVLFLRANYTFHERKAFLDRLNLDLVDDVVDWQAQLTRKDEPPHICTEAVS